MTVLNDFTFKLKVLYWADNEGFSPSVPMKMYHGFMINKIEQSASSKLKKRAWLVVHVITGVFAYPVFSFFSGLGMAVTFLNWHLNGKKHNIKEKEAILTLFRNVHNGQAKRVSFSLTQSNGRWKAPVLKAFREYEIIFGSENETGQCTEQKKSLTTEMERLIEKFTNAYTKVYMHYSGSWKKGMKVSFLAAGSSLPYCSNPLLPKYESISYHPIDPEK